MLLVFTERYHIPRAPRADEAGGLYHALNRGNLRADIFRKEADYAAFERIMCEALEIHQIELYSYQFITNHSRNKNRTLFVSRRIEGVRWEMKHGWNP